MSSYKNVNTDYTLTCNSGNGIFTINAQTVFNGNVTYTVPATTITPFITVAANNTGAITDGGLLMQTGPNTFSGFRFDTTVNAWQTSSSVYANGEPIDSYANLAGVPGGTNTQVQFNSDGAFGASGNLTFDSATGQLTLNGTVTLGNVNAIPANVPNAVVLFSDAPGPGDTGVYATSNAINGPQEMISVSKAIVYSIIF